MWTLEGNAETAFPNQGLEGFPDGRAFQHADGARILRKIRRCGEGGGVRFRCFTIADDTSLVSGSSKGDAALDWWIRRLPCLQRMSSRVMATTSLVRNP